MKVDYAYCLGIVAVTAAVIIVVEHTKMTGWQPFFLSLFCNVAFTLVYNKAEE